MEVAVKVIKNQTAYFNQAIFEAHILKLLNHNHDPDGHMHIVRMYQYFTHASHLCIVFERLHLNLYEVLRCNSYNGLSLDLVCLITKQACPLPHVYSSHVACVTHIVVEWCSQMRRGSIFRAVMHTSPSTRTLTQAHRCCADLGVPMRHQEGGHHPL
jgi:serine/threonine protein kinase